MSRLGAALQRALQKEAEQGMAADVERPASDVPSDVAPDLASDVASEVPSELPILDASAPEAAVPDAEPQAPWRFEDSIAAASAPVAAAVPAQAGEPERDSPSQWDSYAFGRHASNKVIVASGAESSLVEQHRRLAAALHHVQLQRGARSVMITSAVASEGKTLTATNLALTLSHSYTRRVLLIDADLRCPMVHETFGIPNDVGLGDVLLGPDMERLPLVRLSPTLWLLTAGHPIADPISGLVSDTMKVLLAEAVEHFDWVIVDTPPITLLSDANLLARMVDTALIVVGANSTPYPLVKRAVESVGAQRVLGVVLNRIDRRQMVGGYGYYDDYGYYGYASSRKKKVAAAGAQPPAAGASPEPPVAGSADAAATA